MPSNLLATLALGVPAPPSDTPRFGEVNLSRARVFRSSCLEGTRTRSRRRQRRIRSR